MIRFSAHLGYLFNEVPLKDRVAAAAAAGFTAVEHPNPFAISPADMSSLLGADDLVFSQIAAAFGDSSKGEKGITALPGREGDFRSAFSKSLIYATEVDCPFVHPMAGVPPKEAAAEEIANVYRRNVEFAVEATHRLEQAVLIEAISHAAVPGYYMSTIERAVEIQDLFGTETVKLLIDTYHAAANGFDLLPWVEKNIERIGHVHIADNPGRHEPGTGSIKFEPLLWALIQGGYRGAIGFEYIPSKPTTQTLAFLPAWKRLASEIR